MALKTKWLLSKSRSCSCVMPGVYRAVAYSEGCIVIFHSPRGCAHIASTMDIGNQFRLIGEGYRETMDAVPLLSSNMRERDTIFGGTGRLEDAIRYAAEEYRPECIIIAASCVSGIIGDDVEAAAEDAEAELGIPVMAVASAGFLGGEYGDGYAAMTEKIIDRFFRPQEHVPGRVLLLGDQMGPWGQYATEVKEILAAFGLAPTWHFPGYVPFSEWEKIPSASLGIMLGGMGQTNAMLGKISKRLTDEFGIPFLGDVYPVGWENTRHFIAVLAEKLGRAADGAALIEKKEAELSRYVSSFAHVTRGKKAVIAIGRESYWYDPTDTIHTLTRLGMDISAVALFENLPEKEREWMRARTAAACDAPVISMEDAQETIAAADILLTTNEILDPGTRQLFIPMVSLIGASGEASMLRGIYRVLCRYGEKGGIAYV